MCNINGQKKANRNYKVNGKELEFPRYVYPVGNSLKRINPTWLLQ